MEVKILSRQMVKPAISTPDHLRTCKLSFFDQFGPALHTPIVLFYLSDGSNTLMQDKHDQLIKSLSETLSLYYPLAGRFVQDGMYIDCNDKGVEYLEAEVLNFELAELLNEAPKNVELLTHGLVPWDIGEAALVTSPIVGIQVTMFKCGGLVICSHAIADGFTNSTFFRAWSVACREGIDRVVTPSFNLASFFPTRDFSGLIKPSLQVQSYKNIVTKRFLFDEKTIYDLQSKVRFASSSIDTERNLNPTRVEVVASIIWKALIGVDRANHGQKSRNSTFCTTINLRGKIGIKTIPDNSCGNFCVQIPAKLKLDNDFKMEVLELHHLVNLLRKSMHTLYANCSKISNPDELVLEVANHVTEWGEDLGNEQVDVRFFTSVCNFPLYEKDFGWGKPDWVCTTMVPVELVTLLDSKCGTKIEALVSLTETNMSGFQRDPDIVALTSFLGGIAFSHGPKSFKSNI